MRGTSFKDNTNGKCVLFVSCQRELGSGFIQLWERKKINCKSFPCLCYMLNHLQKYIVSMLAFRLLHLFPKYPAPCYWPIPSKSNSIVKCVWGTLVMLAVLVDRSKCRRNWCKSAVHFSGHLWWTTLWDQSTNNSFGSHFSINSWMFILGPASCLFSKNTTANWYVDSHWTAIGSKGPGNNWTAIGIVLANFKSGLYCANLPFGKATTICFPFGLHDAHLLNWIR